MRLWFSLNFSTREHNLMEKFEQNRNKILVRLCRITPGRGLETPTIGSASIFPIAPQSISTAYNCYAKCKNTINDLESTCPEDGKYRTPNSCSSFYICSNGIRFPNIECPNGLHFNGTDCDWPSEVDCPIIETDPARYPRTEIPRPTYR